MGVSMVRENIFAKARSPGRWMGMKACRGSLSLGWAALLICGAATVPLCAQPDGTLRWGSKMASALGSIYSSPAVGADGTIYVGVEVNSTPQDGMLQAVNRDGSIKWTFPTRQWVDSAPAIASDGTIYFGCWNGNLYAVNPDGTQKWKLAVGAIVVSSPAIGADGTIYIGSDDSALHAVSKDGVELWKYATRNSIESSPAVAADGTIYFGSKDSSVYAVTPAGRLKWRTVTGFDVYASPAIDLDGTVYIGSFDGFLYALAPEDGAIKWKFPTGGQIQASAAIGPDRTIYFGSFDKNFYAVNPDGTKKWSVSVGGAIYSSAAMRSDGTVIFGADDGRVRALYTDAGREGLVKWAYLTDDIIESSPVIAPDGSVYVGSIDGKLYAFFGSGAPASGYSRWPMFRGNAVRSGRVASAPDGGRLVNLATRAQAGNGTPLIAGLVTKGTGAKNYLIRAVGPTLEQFGVQNPLRDPTLAVKPLGFDEVLLANDNWGSEGNAAQIATTAAAVGAFALPPGSKDAVVLGALPGGLYTASLGGPGSDTGVALIEAYDADVGAPGARLVNLSTRAQVGTGDKILIPGLVIGGSDPVRVLVRAIGPGLTAFGVSGALTRPTMTVFSAATQKAIGSNTGWSAGVDKGDIAGAAAVVGAFALADGSADCAALLTLTGGAYTIQVSGVGGTTGEALVEVYVLP